MELKSSCGNKGTCGRCAVRLLNGTARIETGSLPDRLQQHGFMLACLSTVQGDATVEIPAAARLERCLSSIQAPVDQSPEDLALVNSYGLQPPCRLIELNLQPPSAEDNTPDLERLSTALRQSGCGLGPFKPDLQLLQRLPGLLRQAEWKVAAAVSAGEEPEKRLISVEPAGPQPPLNLGLALDLGTTTIVAELVDLDQGRTLARAAAYNRQSRYGDDIITRIIHADDNPGGLEALQRAAVATVNDLIGIIMDTTGIDSSQVRAVTVAGNTVMTHLFLGIPPKYIRLPPYLPAASAYPEALARDLGLAVNPGAGVRCFPSVASYVGGDIVAGVLAAGMAREDPLTLFIDIGTNGEMVLGNREWLISCACSAGPAFEGGGITHGMRAARGAIERVEIDPRTLEITLSTIGGGLPAGICGSGLIDLVGKLRRTGQLDRSGRLRTTGVNPRLRVTPEGEREVLLAPAMDTGLDRDITLTESDIQNFIRSKAAVFAGIRCLLKAVGLDLAAIERILVAGEFGRSLNVPNAIETGLLPDLPPEKFYFMANTSLKGARLALLSRPAWSEAETIAGRMTYLELSAGSIFMEEFVSAMFLPHTDLGLFTSNSN